MTPDSQPPDGSNRLEGSVSPGDTSIDDLLRVIPDLIVALSPEGRVLQCNGAARAMLDFAPDELIGKTLSELPCLDAEGLAVAEATLPRLLAGEQLGAVKLPFTHRDGSRRWLEARAGVVVRSDGSQIVRAVLRDATDRVVAEQRLRAIVDHTNDIILILDVDGVIRFANPAVGRVLGDGSGVRVGHSFFDSVHPDDRRAALDSFTQWQAPDANGSLTLRFHDTPGGWRHLDVCGRNMLNVPAVKGMLAVARDISDRLGLQERLEGAERLDSIGRLAGGIAHDFNNMLAVILASAEHLRDRESPGDGHAVDRDVDLIVEAAERARTLTSKLLTFARRQPTEPGEVDAAASLLVAESFLRRLVGEGSSLTIEVPDVTHRVPLSPAQFEQVLLNLAANARDAMPEGGDLRITVREVEAAPLRRAGLHLPDEGPVACLSISDTGTGMSPEVVARVFEPFYTTKERGRGTGLGLSMVYGIIRGAGGDIRVASQVGEGTVVDVFLPRLPETATRHIMTRSEPSGGGFETVLVVEDNDDIRRLTTRTLQQVGYRVLQAASGASALDLVSAGESVDLVVTDVIMPLMNGVTMAREMRKLRAGMPVLFITGYTPEHVLERQALDARTALLTKPFKREAFLQHVRQMLDVTAA